MHVKTCSLLWYYEISFDNMLKFIKAVLEENKHLDMFNKNETIEFQRLITKYN